MEWRREGGRPPNGEGDEEDEAAAAAAADGGRWKGNGLRGRGEIREEEELVGGRGG